MKRRFSIILLMLCTLLLTGFTSTGRFSGVDMEVMEDYDTDYNTWNTICLEGKYISMPCNAKLFTDLGYRVPTDVPNVAPNYKMSAVSFIDGKGNELSLGIINLGDSPKPVSECYVYDVTWDSRYTGNIDIHGAGQGSTVAEVTRAIGEAVHKGDGLNGAVMRMYESDKDEREISVTYDTNDIAIEFSISTEEPEIYGYQSQWDENLPSPDKTSVDETKWHETENVISVVDTSPVAPLIYILIPLVFIILTTVVIFTIVVHRLKKMSDHEVNAFARAEELKEARRVLNTDIDELADEVSDEGN